MKSILLLFLLLSSSTIGAEPWGPFESAIAGFSEALVPLLQSSERAKIETTLRGFTASADTIPDITSREPSEWGLRLDAAVRDAEEVNEFSDSSERPYDATHRMVRIPAPTRDKQALVIHLRYGSKFSPEVIRVLDKCIAGIAALSKKDGKQ